MTLDTDTRLRKGHRVRHKIVGWKGTVSSAKNTGIPTVTVLFDNGRNSTLPRDSVERIVRV